MLKFHKMFTSAIFLSAFLGTTALAIQQNDDLNHHLNALFSGNIHFFTYLFKLRY